MTKRKNTPVRKKILLRLEETVYDKVAALADKERRSVHRMIEILIERGLKK